MFVKIGSNRNIELLRTEGLIFSNSIEYFRTLETTDKARRDHREGCNSSIKLNNFKLFIGEEKKEFQGKFTKVKMHTFDTTHPYTHLYCLYCFKPHHVTGHPFIDDRNITFGDKALIIYNKEEFLERFRKATHGIYNYSYGTVKYYDDNETQENLTVFDKPNCFEYQSEFRFHIKEVDVKPISFKIGSLEDISIVIDAADLTKVSLKYE